MLLLLWWWWCSIILVLGCLFCVDNRALSLKIAVARVNPDFTSVAGWFLSGLGFSVCGMAAL